MKPGSRLLACLLASLAGLPVAVAQGVGGSSFRGGSIAVNDMFSDAGNAPDAQLYADGKRAIRDSRWADAVTIFGRVNANGEHAAGALYWKAYAQNKLGQGDKAVETCRSLRTQFAGSSWVDDCGALEIEIRASKGQVVEPEPGQSDELKLLALTTLMQKDPPRARAQIEEIVAGDSSEALKEGAVFILGRSIPDVTYAQVVRISYLSGDVRIARGVKNQRAHSEMWETAAMNLALSGGDSIVTGKDGNVEIEFEDASTVYLAPDSVLTCDDLHTTDGVPHSEIGLLTGTLTLHLDSLKPGETFMVKTLTNDLLMRFPHKSVDRISSYSDGTVLTSLLGGVLDVPGRAEQPLPAGKMLFIDQNHHVVPWDPDKGGDFSAFDAWVGARYSARKAAMAEEMKASGLTTPIPGLADMKGQGDFYACEPYGTCWEPDSASRNAALTSGPAPDPRAKSAAPTTSNLPKTAYRGEFFFCLPGIGIDSVPSPYAWAVCHAGSWILHNQHYVWVASHHIHHRCPVHWVKFGKSTAFVPIHPRDVKGQPPLNLERAFIAAKGKDGYSLSVVTFHPSQPVAVMKSPPREFRNPPLPLLTRAETPHMMAYSVRQSGASPGTKQAVTTPVGEPIRFNHQTQSFSMAHQVIEGGHSRTVYTPLGHGSGGFEGGHAGGGSSGGSSQAGAARASVSSSGSSNNLPSTSNATNANSSAGSSRH